MIKNLLIYKSESLNPYHNLAAEKLLFDTLPNETLILYLWQNENTVVIGKNQNPWAECKLEELKATGGFLARRLSGGGAVFHDTGNLNFTFIASSDDLDVLLNLSVIKTACAYLGINAEFSGRNDILIDGKKFSGNAFYSSQGKSYHHGTLLISSDVQKVSKFLTPPREKLQAKGIKSVSSRVITLNSLLPALSIEQMKNLLIRSASEVFSLLPVQKDFPIISTELIDFFADWNFIFGKTIPFTVSLSKRFLWGSTELNLEIKDGKIVQSQLFTDALDQTISSLVEQALLDCNLTYASIKERLDKVLSSEVSDDLLNLIKENVF